MRLGTFELLLGAPAGAGTGTGTGGIGASAGGAGAFDAATYHAFRAAPLPAALGALLRGVPALARGVPVAGVMDPKVGPNYSTLGSTTGTRVVKILPLSLLYYALQLRRPGNETNFS